ncbi:MAG: PDZ domain-containing protein [Candidatus Aminicenantales bacterium]
MKRSILVATTSLLLIGHLFGMTDENTAGKIPFKKIAYFILVTTKINDSKNDYNFIIDTGGVALIDKAVVQELGLKQRGPMAKITTLNLSGYQIENVFCFTTFDFNIFRQLGTPIHGIIGSNLMERFKVTIDFQSCSIIFSTDTTSLTPPDNGIFFTFRNHPVNNAPIIKFKVNQKIIEGMIDTGQPYPVVLPLKDFEQYEKSNNPVSIRSKGLMIKWPQTTPQYNYLTRLKSCEFGSLKITDALGIFGELPPLLSMPLIGTDLLSQFKIIINYPKDEMLFIPNPDIHFENNQFSLGLNLNLSEKDEIWVEGVWENSPADKANIQVGDQVIAFNSKKVTPENLIELMEMMKDDHIESIHLEIKNQNGIRKLKLNKTMLF